MTDLDDQVDPTLLQRVERHLGEQAAAVQLRPSSVSDVARQAGHRQNRTRAGAALGMVAVVASVVAGVAVGVRDDRDGVRPVSPSPDPTVLDAVTDSVAPTSTPATSVEISATTTISNGAPGTGATRVVDYRWEVVPDTGEPAGTSYSSGDNVRLSTDLSAPAVLVSDDGLQWTSFDLDPGEAPIVATGTLDLVRVVVLAGPADDRDLRFVELGAGARRSHPVPMTPSPEYGGGGATMATIGDTTLFGVWLDESWRIFRVEADAPPVEITDRFPFGPVPLEGPAPSVRAIDGSFAVFSPAETSSGVLGPDGALTTPTAWDVRTSRDGLTWSDPTLIPWGICCATRSAGEWLAFDDTLVLQRSADGTAWTRVDLGDGADDEGRPWVANTSAVPTGDRGVVVVATRQAPLTQLSVTENGVTMVFDQSMQLLEAYDEATGALIGSTAQDTPDDLIELAMEAPPTLRVFAPDGTVRAEFTVEEATAAVVAAPETAPELSILHSTDLETWTRTDVRELTGGEPAWAELVGDFDGRLVFRVHDRQGGTSLLIGTPSG